MANTLTKLVVKKPSECSEKELDDFYWLVLMGGEVPSLGLKSRIMTSYLLGFTRLDKNLVGVGAIKKTDQQYIQSVALKSGYADLVKSDKELGHLYVEPEHRHQGVATLLAEALLKKSIPPIFAITRKSNEAVHGLLQKRGFEKAGNPWKGHREDLFLWIKNN